MSLTYYGEPKKILKNPSEKLPKQLVQAVNYFFQR